MSDCRDRNPRNMGMVCSLPAGHASPHAFGDGGTWPLSAENDDTALVCMERVGCHDYRHGTDCPMYDWPRSLDAGRPL